MEIYIKKNVRHFIATCLLLITCKALFAENISDAEYAYWASKFYSYEFDGQIDSLFFNDENDTHILQDIKNYTQNLEYTISQDNNHQTYITKILIVAKDNLYSSIPSYIIRYAHDIHNAFGCAVNIVSVEGESASQIRSLIQTYSSNLNGVVFVGDIAPAFYHLDTTSLGSTIWIADTFPCDLFYMDINGSWQLQNGSNNVYDNHTGNVKPEIFIGRINTATMGKNEIEELIYFFDRNHQYWTGRKALNHQRALTYTQQSWDYSEFWNSVAPLYGTNHYDVVTADHFEKSNYLGCLQNSNYEFIQLACHSSYNYHEFDKTTTPKTYIYSSEIEQTAPKQQIGYNLYCCHACNWSKYSTFPCIGESYLYGQNNNSSTLAIVGSTKTGSMLGFDKFYTPLGNGKCIGQALKEWWINHCGSSHSLSEKLWFYGMTILGDPLIDFNFSNECEDTLIINTGEELTNNQYYAQNEIIVQNYSITQGQSVTLSAPTIQINGPFVCNSSTLTTNINDYCICNSPRSSMKKYGKSTAKELVSAKDIHKSNKALSLYPNPVRDILTIDITEDDIIKIDIYNLNGQCVLRTAEKTVNVSYIPVGIYIVCATTPDGREFQCKFLKQ